MTSLRRLTDLLGFGEASRLSTAIGLVISVIGVGTGIAFGVSGLIFTCAILVMAVFVVAVVTSPRHPGDGDGGPAGSAL